MTERPRFAFAYEEMALVAADLRRGRAVGDPKLVEDGRLTIDEAKTRLRIASALAVDWAHFARMDLPPLDETSDAEKIASLRGAIVGTAARRDAAHAAMIGEYGQAIAHLSLTELWAIHEAHDSKSQRILPYLNWESYTAALEAMLWWQTRPRDQGRRMITMVNIELRRMGYVEQDKAAA